MSVTNNSVHKNLNQLQQFCFVFAAKTHAVSLLVGSACQVFSFKPPGRIAWRIISSDALEYNKYNLHAFPVYFNIIILHPFMAARAPEEKRCSLRDAAIFKCNEIYLQIYLPHFPLAVHDLSPLAS